MSESSKRSESSEPERIETLTTADILDRFRNDAEAQKQVFGKELSIAEFEKRFGKGISTKDITKIMEAIGLRPASLEDLGIDAPEFPKATERKESGQTLADEFMKEINALQAGRKLETLSTEELKKVRDKYVAIKQVLGLEQEKSETALAIAREIMGEDFFGAEEIKDTFDIEVAPSEIPPIPYTPEQLDQAKTLGEKLILRVSYDGEHPMTMERINAIMQPKMESDDKFLYDTDWYEDEDFYKKHSLKTEWKLVGGSFVPDMSSEKDGEGKYTKDSTNNNYIHQTRLLREYLKSAGSLNDAEAAECSDETLKQLSSEMGVNWDSQDITDSDAYKNHWQEVAKKLAELKINKNHRRTPAEILYDFSLQHKKTGERGLLENYYDWSPVLSSVGDLVYVGPADSGGASVDWDVPDYRNDYLGVVSLR